jgi:hypothetical protein
LLSGGFFGAHLASTLLDAPEQGQSWSSVAAMKRISIVVALVAGGACKKKVDSEDFEARLKKRTEELGITGAAVKCPSGIEAKVGQSFDCTVTADGKDYMLTAKITKVDGKQLGMDTNWKNGDAVMPAKLGPALETELGKQFGTKVAVDCGKDALAFLDKNRNVTCDLTAGDQKAKVLVTFDEKLVPTKWQLDPMMLSKAKLEELLTAPVQAKTSPTAKVTCGDKPLVPRPADGNVMCDLSDGDKEAHLKVAVDENLEVKGWEVAP